MKIYTGDKPCPCCGKSSRETTRYFSDSICNSCRDVYQKGKEAIAHSKNDTDIYVYANFYPPVTGDSTSSDAAFRALFKCIKIYSNPNAEYSESVSWGYFNPGSRYEFILKKSFYDELVPCLNNLVNALKNGYEKGKEHGSSLLRQLASGEISSTKFDEYAVAKQY